VPNVSWYQIGAVLHCNGTRVSDPDPHRSGSRRAKKPQKYKKVKIFNALKSWMFSFEGLRILL
jgi:hypothetical protein